MYRLRRVYGKRAYDGWTKRNGHLRDLRSYEERAGDGAERWVVSAYRELVQAVAFLSVMNKRLVLYFRGQRTDYRLLPSLLRDTWVCPGSDERVPVDGYRRHYWESLALAGTVAYQACEEFGLPRWRTMQRVPEAQWAIVQHYGLWPTPFIDVTRSLRVAATFALPSRRPTSAATSGYLYVLGMPAVRDSISISFDDQLMLSRLEAVCPPVAKRPHFQEGALLSRFPFEESEILDEPKPDGRRFRRFDAARRLIAKFELLDAGTFWNDDAPLFWSSLLPEDDDLVRWFARHVAYELDGDKVTFRRSSGG